MIIKDTKDKFQQLNQQPEDVRIRAAIRLSIVIGAILIPLVLLVLLPIQTKIQQARNQTDSKYAASKDDQSQSLFSQLKQLTSKRADSGEANINAPQVGGVSNVNSQDLLVPFSNSAPFVKAKSFNPNNIPVEIAP